MASKHLHSHTVTIYDNTEINITNHATV